MILEWFKDLYLSLIQNWVLPRTCFHYMIMHRDRSCLSFRDFQGDYSRAIAHKHCLLENSSDVAFYCSIGKCLQVHALLNSPQVIIFISHITKFSLSLYFLIDISLLVEGFYMMQNTCTVLIVTDLWNMFIYILFELKSLNLSSTCTCVLKFL